MEKEQSQTDYSLVAQAIDYIDHNRLAQPSLENIAANVGVSPFHLQRVFTRWAGISPKRFLQYLTLEHAKELLTESKPVLEAAYCSGLSSPGRLHDLFVSVDAVTPGEYKAGGAGLTISYGRHETPFGDCLLAMTERGVTGLSFLDSSGWDGAVRELRQRWPGAKLKEQPEVTFATAERIFAAARAESDEPLSLHLKGTNFQLKVWDALLRIPPGAVNTYGDIACAIDYPSASRAVGGAVGDNPVAFLIPCHRVIRSSGRIGNYRWGATRKRAMIGWESARREIAVSRAAVTAR